MSALKHIFYLTILFHIQLFNCDLGDSEVDAILTTAVSSFPISCAARKDISPCTCYQNNYKDTIIRVICQKMTSFNQIIQTLRNKIDKNSQILLVIDVSNLEDLSEKKFSDLQSYIAELWLRKNNMGEGLSTKSFEGIDTVTSLMLIDSKIKEFPGTIFEHMPNVSGVTIQRTHIRSVSPADFKSLKKLATLIIKECNLTYIESNTFSPTLRNINLSVNNITTLNHTLRNNTLLMAIVLSKNRIETLESQLPDFYDNYQLYFLDVSSNKLTRFPKSFVNLHVLRSLIAGMNQIEGLDNVISNKRLLLELDLTKNRIRQLSSTEFQGCSSMTHLDLSYNELTTMNGSLLPLQSLENLNLTRNKFTDFSIQEIKGLKSLKFVDLSHNKLQKFTGVMENDTNIPETLLDELYLQFNELEILEGSLAAIKNLKTLNMSYNRLSVIPREFLSSLTELQQLDVSHNQLLTLIDVSKAFLPSLGILHASSNKLTELSQQSTSGFIAVCFMHLQNNKIKVLKEEFFERNQCLYKPGVKAMLYVYLEGNGVLCKDDIQETIAAIEAKNRTKIVGQCSETPPDGLKYNIGQSNNTDTPTIAVVTLEH